MGISPSLGVKQVTQKVQVLAKQKEFQKECVKFLSWKYKVTIAIYTYKSQGNI